MLPLTCLCLYANNALNSRVKETLPKEILNAIHAPPQDESVPFITPEKLEEYDAFLFGIPTRYGNFPVQWRAFWDATGPQWMKGGYWGKYCGLFIGTASQGGGQESTALAAMSTLAHHGIIYVPLGYATVSEQLSTLDEVRGGSAWGAGTFAVSDILLHLLFRAIPHTSISCSRKTVADIVFCNIQGGDGSRQPSKTELSLAEAQGNAFYKHLTRVNFG